MRQEWTEIPSYHYYCYCLLVHHRMQNGSGRGIGIVENCKVNILLSPSKHQESHASKPTASNHPLTIHPNPKCQMQNALLPPAHCTNAQLEQKPTPIFQLSSKDMPIVLLTLVLILQLVTGPGRSSSRGQDLHVQYTRAQLCFDPSTASLCCAMELPALGQSARSKSAWANAPGRIGLSGCGAQIGGPPEILTIVKSKVQTRDGSVLDGMRWRSRHHPPACNSQIYSAWSRRCRPPPRSAL